MLCVFVCWPRQSAVQKRLAEPTEMEIRFGPRWAQGTIVLAEGLDHPREGALFLGERGVLGVNILNVICKGAAPVSYTHLTLPTNREV